MGPLAGPSIPFTVVEDRERVRAGGGVMYPPERAVVVCRILIGLRNKL